MALLIDGYNLLHASGILGRGVGPGGLERARNALLNFLAESLEANEVSRATVVFDAADGPRHLARHSEHKGLTVRYASDHASADELIEELIVTDSAPRRLTVVSSDHRLHKAARRRRATAVDSDRWFREIVRQRQERAQGSSSEPPKPDAPLSDVEVDFWLREFDGGGN